MGATETIASFIAGLKYEDLPTGVVEAAKVAIIDGISVMLAGTTQPLAAVMSDYVRDLGGAPHCTVSGFGFKTNAPSAAFANGVFGHCLDFEIQGDPPTHGTSSCLPAALALGEKTGASGKTIIESYVLGWEVQGRLRAATARSTNPAYHPPGLVGPLGSAAASAKTLGLDANRTSMALGIAASRTGGLTANTGTMVKSTHPGNAARMGVEAAMLAQAGFISSEDILETENGYVDALFQGDVDWDMITEGLGNTYRLITPGYDIKRFPAQLHMQRSIEAAINLRQRNNLQADMVEALILEVRDRGHSKAIPRSGLDGKFSVEYCAAAALLDGRVDIETFTDERRFNADMEELLPRVRVAPSDEPMSVNAIAKLKDGRAVSEVCRDFTGSVANPMSRDERLAKVQDCAHRALSEQDTERLIDILENLEELNDISELMNILGKKHA